MNALVRLFISFFAAIAMVVVAMAFVATAHASEPGDGTDNADVPQDELSPADPAESSPDDPASETGPPVDEPASEPTAPATEPASDYLAPAEEPAQPSPTQTEELEDVDLSSDQVVDEPITATSDATGGEIAAVESEETVARPERRRGSTIAPDFETNPLASDASSDAEAAADGASADADEARTTAEEALTADEDAATSAAEATQEVAQDAAALAQDVTAQAEAAAQEQAAAAEEEAAAAQQAAQEQAAAAEEAAESALPDADTIQDMIDVLLEVREQIDDPEGKQLIDDAIAILVDALDAAREAEAQNGDSDGASNGSNTTTTPDTGDAEANANSGDTGDASAEVEGHAQSGDTGDSTAGSTATSGGDDPPDGGGGDPPTDPPACDETAADNPAAVSASSASDGASDQCPGGSGGFSGAPIDIALPCRTVAADSKHDDPIVAWLPVLPGGTVARNQAASAGEMAAWRARFDCARDSLIEQDEPALGCTYGRCAQAAPAQAKAVDSGARVDAGGSAYTYRVAGAASHDAHVAGIDDAPRASVAAGPSDLADSPIPVRSPVAAMQTMGSLNPFGNSGTAQPSFQTGSALAYVSPWLAPDVVLSYDRGTTSSTDNVSSRSDEPPTPPG